MTADAPADAPADMPVRGPADPLALARLRASIRGIDADGLDLPQIEAALAAHEAALDASRPWFLPGTDTAEETVATLRGTAHLLADGGPLGAALEDVLLNAASHTPAFAEQPDGTPMPRPWGCTVCGCADGTGACDTWEAGLRLAEALLAPGTAEYGRRIVDDSCGNGHLVGLVPAVYRTREQAMRGGNGLGMFPDQRLVRRFATAWIDDPDPVTDPEPTPEYLEPCDD